MSSLFRITARSPKSIRHTCCKAFSTTTTLCEDRPSISPTDPFANILEALPTSQSLNQSHPSTPRPEKYALSASRFAKQTLRRDDPDTAIASQKLARRDAFARQIFRKWQPGDVYAPHDLTGQEQKKWKAGKRTPTVDAFDTLGINPIKEYKNFTMMSEYMTEMGRIKHSSVTGLRPVNQRKIAKAIRRAIGLGLMPSVHRHPLVLKNSHPAKFM